MGGMLKQLAHTHEGPDPCFPQALHLTKLGFTGIGKTRNRPEPIEKPLSKICRVRVKRCQKPRQETDSVILPCR